MLKLLELSSLSNSWLGLLVLFVYFFIFLLAIMGWGFRFLGKNEEDIHSRAGASFLGASFFSWLVPAILGSIGFLKISIFLWLMLLLPGLKWVMPLASEVLKKSWENKYWSALFLFLLFVRILAASIPQSHGDPLLYHLLGPRLWTQHGGFYISPDLPNAILASSWEYFYIWPQRLFLFSNSAAALAGAQIFSQWTHLFFGWIGLAILLPLVFREQKLNKKWEYLLALAALAVSGIQWTSGLAKNDGGVAFWCLGSVWFLQKAVFGKKEKQNYILAGIFAGLAFTGKVTALLNLGFLFLGLAVYLFVQNRKTTPKYFLTSCSFIIIGCLATALPIYVRNYILTANPFYPMFDSVFPSEWVSTTWRNHFAQVHPSLSGSLFAKLLFRIPELFRESPWIMFAPLSLIIARIDRRKTYWLLGVFAHLALLFFIATQAKEIELRYMGAVLLILTGMGITFFAAVEKKIPNGSAMYLFIFVLAACLATSRIPVHILRKQWDSKLGEAYVATHTAGESKAWLRNNMKPGEKAVMAGDNEAYYLSTVAVTVLTENPALDRATIEERDLKKYLLSICEITHARYFLDARPQNGFEARFGKSIKAESKIFEAQGAPIYDLHILGKLQNIDMINCK